ncbi:MAG: cell division protein ZapA [Christensenellaceae bacterium]|jgi:cell division protein ZapA
MEKIKTVVNIAGKEYTIIGTDSEEFMHRVALRVNSKYEELRKSNPDLNNVQLSMLTALNVSEDYLKLHDEVEGLKKELEEARQELEKYKKPQATSVSYKPEVGRDPNRR